MLYLITNRSLAVNKDLLSIVEKAVEGGIDALILREKDLSYTELYPLAEKLKSITRGKCKFIINNNFKVATELGVDGYHTSFSSFITERPCFTGQIGVSVHRVEEAVDAEQQGASYLLAGHIFETDCKKGIEPKGTQMLKDIKEKVHIPVIALGGIQIENISLLAGSGADGVAVMSSIMKAKDPYNLVKRYKEALRIRLKL